jgi:flagellar motor switch protein FliN/FliY
MSDLLSQEQIDALLNSQEESSSFGGGDAGDSGPDYAKLSEALQSFNETAGSVIGIVLNKTITFTTEVSQATDPIALENSLSGPLLEVNLPLSGGLSGEWHLLINKKAVAMLADLMLMGDGSADYTDDHKDAVAELFSQVLGNFCTSAGEKAGSPVQAGAIHIRDFSFSSPPFAFDETAMAVLKVKVADAPQGEVSAGIVMSADDCRALIAVMVGDEQSGMGGGGVGLSQAELDDLSYATDTSFGSSDSSGRGADSFMASRPQRQASSFGSGSESIDMLLDVELDVSIELGRADLSIKRILELAPGSIVELDRMAGEPVDLLVNGKVVAKGEVVVVDENFGIRIVSLVSPEERIRSLR